MLSSSAVSGVWLLFIAFICLIPFSEVATAWVNRLAASLFGAAPLPGLELLQGVPTHCRTMVVIPTLLSSEQDILQQVEQLEVHYLSGGQGDITFALLADGVDADSEILAGDGQLLTRASLAIRQINQRYGPGEAGDRFYCCTAEGCSTPVKTSGWAGSVNGENCMSLTGCCAAPPIPALSR